MAINAVSMMLDFVFKADSALKGFQQTTGGFTKMGDAANTFANYASIVEKDWVNSFGTMYQEMQHNSAFMKGLPSSIQEAFNTTGAELFRDSLDQIYNSTLNVVSGIKGVAMEDAVFTANATMHEVLQKAGTAANNIGTSFKKLGIEFNNAKMSQRMVKLQVESEKTFNKLNNVVEEATRLSAGLNTKQLAQYRAHMNQLQRALDEGAISTEEYIKSQDRLNYRFSVMNERLPEIGRNFRSLFSGIQGGFMSTLAAASVLDDAFSAQKQTVETTHRLALRNNQIFHDGATSAAGFTGTVMNMNAAIRQTAGQTQISMTEAASAMNSLASARIPGTIEDLQELSVTSVRMQQAFGISEGAAADMFRTLSLAGNISPEGIKAVGEALADTQAVWGMTSEEVTEAASTIGHVINRMTSLGANSKKNANIVAREVGRMTTAFTRAGMSAQDATQMMDRFMDPTKIEDNALLWHSMGMSVSDGLAMMTGDASSMEGMTEKLMQTAKNLRDEYGQNPLALQAMAEAHGMTIQQVNQLANEMEREANMTDEARRALEQRATLEEQANQARESAAEALKRLAAFGNVLMQTFIMPLIDLLTPIISGLAKLAGWFNNIMDDFVPFGGIIKGVLGAMLLFTIVSRIKLLELLSPIQMLGGGKGFGGLFNTIKNGASTGISAVTSFGKAFVGSMKNGLGPMKALQNGFKQLTGKLSGGASAAGNAGNAAQQAANKTNAAGAAAQQNPAVQKGPTFLQQLAKVPPQTLLALSVAILAVGAAIAVIALGFSVLANSLKELDLAQLLVLLGLAIVIMGGFAAAMYFLAPAVSALGAAGAGAAPGLLALAVALVALGAGIALIVLSVAVLVAAMSLTENVGLQMILLAVGIIALGGALFVFGSIITSAAPIIWMGIAVLAALAATMIVVGLGMLIFGVGLAIVSANIVGLGAGLAIFAASVGSLAGAAAMLLPLGVALGIFAFAAFMAAPGIFFLAVAFAVLAGSFAIIGTALGALNLLFTNLGGMMDKIDQIKPLFDSLSEALGGFIDQVQGIGAVANGLMMFAMSMAILAMFSGIIAAAMPVVVESLNTLSQIDPTAFAGFGDALSGIAGPLAQIGIIAAIFALPLFILGQAFIALGHGLVMTAQGFELFSSMSETMSSTTQSVSSALQLLASGMLAVAAAAPGMLLGFLGLTAMIPMLLILNFFMGAMAHNFYMMGQGAVLFANNIAAVLSGIEGLGEKISGVRGLVKEFTEDIKALNASIMGIGGLGLMVAQSLSTTVEKEPSQENDKQIQTVEILNRIDSNTLRTAIATEKMLARMDKAQTSGGAFRATTETGLG